MTALPAAFRTTPLAHRALHGAGLPENSLGAIRAAVAAGYGIEIDVQPSLDGAAMVFHDYDLKRLTGESGPIAARPAKALEALSLRAGGPIPTLERVLEDIAGRVPLLIEVKDQDGAMGPNVGPLERAVARALVGYRGAVAVMSFNPYAVAALADAAPHIPRGLTTCAFTAKHWPRLPAATRRRLRAIPDYTRVGAGFISHRWADLPRVAEFADRGALLCWTVRSRAEETTARRVAHNVTFEGYLP
ncbi:glycerophosphoryl diester phosphodiesterase [Rhodovulum imhoffii]|uniref:Glycerophosphoryl diester phosphodiesterase n=1 Tax=Rhodovulum imhoffii TaxID=365340 RepID=A0A2T5BU57_9RHOB|nr:glycerophosphodiester phosphodiesterase family protein [Rhodovulum imhoffii]MBK5934584.1 phosphodiesterase [Rhodovulum imhoffii]PTN02999.1 glycerophosphoryl diester phosphodiesterase [Rhodovulum imhoffii]